MLNDMVRMCYRGGRRVLTCLENIRTETLPVKNRWSESEVICTKMQQILIDIVQIVFEC